MSRRFLRALGALVALGVIVLGVPLALLAVGRFGGLLTIDWSRVFSTPDDGRLLLGVLTIVGWVAWAVVAATVVFEVIALATSGRVRLRVPGTSWLRPIMAALIVSVGALSFAPQGQPATPARAEPNLTTSSQVEAQEQSQRATHTVTAGDDLWTLAERYLGDGSQWRKIAQVNPGLDPAERLEAGLVLILPEEADPTDLRHEPAGAPRQVNREVSMPVSAPGEVVVRRGDTLWSLAKTHLGDPLQWPRIYELNRDQISNPDEIDIGWVLRLPAVPQQPEMVPPALDPAPVDEQVEPSVSEVPAGEVDVLVIGKGGGARPTSESTSSLEEPPAPTEEQSHSALVMGIGGTLALGLVGTLYAHRRRQLGQRGLGRRISPPSVAAQRFESALGQKAIGATTPGQVSDTSVVLGWCDEEALCIDLEDNRVTHLVAADSQVRDGALAALSSSLFCASWSASVEQVLVGSSASWVLAADDPRCVAIDDASAAIARLEDEVANRRSCLREQLLCSLRADPDTSSSWQPIVFVFCAPLLPQQRRRIVEALSGPQVGVSAVLAASTAPVTGCVVAYADDGASATYREKRFVPQLVGAPARRALIELVAAATTETTEPAWWWNSDDLPPNVTRLRIPVGVTEEPGMDLSPETIRTPTLLLLGPVELLGTVGEEPTRAVQQCMEYCAWILANPGKTATAMTADLLVAETTRRSNMSRLRTWLGKTIEGEFYLPEAYSGRIQLHHDVTSDWELFTTLLLGGVNRASAQSLRRALALVRGAPFADSPPWPWAEQWRLDMVSAIRDAGVTLARLALEADDLDLARWAINRASAAAPDDELLVAALVQVEHRCHNDDEVKRLVLQLTRNARATGIDLSDETVSVLQEVLEGRRRARSV